MSCAPAVTGAAVDRSSQRACTAALHEQGDRNASLQHKIIAEHNAKISAFNDRLQAAVDQDNKHNKHNKHVRQLRDFGNSTSDYIECEGDALHAQNRKAQATLD